MIWGFNLRKTFGRFLMTACLATLATVGCTDSSANNPVEEATQGEANEMPATPPDGSGESNSEGANGMMQGYTPKTIYFAFDSSELSSEAQGNLGSLAENMKAGPTTLRIEGHCDERGTTEYNLALGERRAQSVKNYLVALGIEDHRIETVSYGEEKPAMEGHDESAWSQNRRAEFILSGN